MTLSLSHSRSVRHIRMCICVYWSFSSMPAAPFLVFFMLITKLTYKCPRVKSFNFSFSLSLSRSFTRDQTIIAIIIIIRYMRDANRILFFCKDLFLIVSNGNICACLLHLLRLFEICSVGDLRSFCYDT